MFVVFCECQWCFEAPGDRFEYREVCIPHLYALKAACLPYMSKNHFYASPTFRICAVFETHGEKIPLLRKNSQRLDL